MASALQRLFNVRRDEFVPVLLAAGYFFCILTALMVLRPAREALGLQRGIESVRWLFLGTVVATLLVNPLFGLLVSRFPRLRFITATYAFFAASLLGFYALMTWAPERIGVTSGQVFYVWFSVCNLFVTMVFWALMADRFSLEQSKRFFALISVGGTCGAVFGPWLASRLAQPLGTPALLPVAVAFLALAVAAARAVARIQPERARPGADADPEAPPAVDEAAIIGGSAWEGLRAVFRSRYLLGIAGYLVTLTLMGTLLYFTRLQMIAALGDELDLRTTMFARIDLITQFVTLALQAVVAGHLMKRLGVHVTLALLPIAAALGFAGLAVVGSLAALVAVEATFRALQRAVVRPARETLFTVVRRADKYKSKAFIDTFVYRAGDALGAQTEGLLGRLGLGLVALAGVAVPLALAWAALGVWLGLAQRGLADRRRGLPLAAELASTE